MYSKKMQVVPPRRRSFLGFGDAALNVVLSPPFVGPTRSPPFVATTTSVLTAPPAEVPASPTSSPIAGIPPYVLLGGAALVAYFVFGRK